jgi:hypothetical protein
VTLRDIVYIHSYFQRHAVDKLWQRDPPSNGWIAWLLWGGDAGREWATKIYEREVGRKPKSKKKRSRSRFDDPFDPSSSVIDVVRENRSQIAETVGLFAGGRRVARRLFLCHTIYIDGCSIARFDRAFDVA